MLGIVLLFNVTACGTTKCSHSYSSEITKAATCKETGIKTYTCSVCGDSYTEEIPQLTTHSYTSKVTKTATCKETGIKTYTCSVCGDSYTEEIPQLTTHSYTSKVTKTATCKETGIKTYTCSVCGDSYTEKIGMIVHKEGEKCFSCIIKMPSPPMTLNWYMRIYIDGSFKNVVYSSTKITNITYKYNETSKKLNFYFTGEITYLRESNTHRLAEFSIVLYDSKGYSVGSCSFTYNTKNGGYKFKDDFTWMWIELDLNETYTLVLSDYYL